MIKEDPINCIEWRDVDSLNANAWNPNMVMNPELKLLEISLLSTGWVQPILITPDGTIIDGFHRWMLSRESKVLRQRYGGKVPCAILEVSPAEAKMLTVRMNRAKGCHGAVRMSELVKSLIDEHGCSPAEVAREIGATRDEVDLLYQDSIFKARNIEHYRYSRAWVPAEEARK
ncbi:MAG TPA: ParB N-terminal domain-containing protein [Chthonomonadaceae bacterium]|nr:ParB N-terminal domain-containing protein [Chthonomonadaceae bacterium]